MTILDGEDVDTGPGLETRHSCEFISQPEPDQPFLQGNGTYPLKSELKAAANGHHQGSHTLPVDARPNLEEQIVPSVGGSPLSENEGMYTGFAASSSEPWTEDHRDPSHPAGLQNAPSRAETAEEMDVRVRAEKRQKRAVRAAQISSLATLSLLLIAAIVFLVLAYTGWNALAAALALFCASIAGYPFLHLLFYGLSSQIFVKTWRSMSPVERFKWGQKGASLVHSGIMASVGLTIVLQGSWRAQDLLSQRDDRVAAFIGLELGYLIQDTGMEAYKHFAFGRSSSALHWLHHLTLLGLLPWYYKYQKGDFFVGALFLWSTSTVPLHLRWFQVQANMNRGILYQLNNAALLLSFLACRIISIPFLLQLYGIARGWTFSEVPFRIHWTCSATALLLMTSNLGWLVHLLKNAFKPRPRRSKFKDQNVKVDGKAA